jgi:multidrug resistance efflux pump
MVQSSVLAKRIAKMLVVGLVASIVAMMILPWQQTSRGSGQVVAYAPQERQQTIQSQVEGVVSYIGEGMVEGRPVRRGDVILEIQPIAANQVMQVESQLKDLQQKQQTYKTKAEVYGEQIKVFEEARDFTVAAAQQMVESAKAKLSAKQKLIPGYQAKVLQATQNYERQKKLENQGFQSNKEVEKLIKNLENEKAELSSLNEDINALRKEVLAKENELNAKRKEMQSKVESSRAFQQDALGMVATTQKEIRELEVKLEAFDGRVVEAPRDGTIFRMSIAERGQLVKKGDPLLTIVPDATQNAVELTVPGNDMPLIQVGQEVRLQFEGWPAVQFAGWPSVSVGTFGGLVTAVDPTDDGKGKFRILITPSGKDEWPTDRYLRQGVRVNGWVMLRRVSLGYEIWRQLNGFPVIIADEEPGKQTSKVPKLPK